MRVFQSIFEHNTAVGQADKRMLEMERGEMAGVDAELAIASYWRLFHDLIYAKVARLEAGPRQSTQSEPDAHGNVYVQSSGSTHDVEHSVHMMKTRFIDRLSKGAKTDEGKEFDDSARDEFVKPLRSMVPDPKYIPTLIRMYAQDIVPTYDWFTDEAEGWLDVLTEYDKAKTAGLLSPKELEIGMFTHPTDFLKAVKMAAGRKLVKRKAPAKKLH